MQKPKLVKFTTSHNFFKHHARNLHELAQLHRTLLLAKKNLTEWIKCSKHNEEPPERKSNVE